MDGGVRQSQPIQNINDVGQFRGGRLQKLEAGGGGIEKVSHLNAGSRRKRGWHWLAFRPAFNSQPPGGVGLGCSACDGQPTHRANGGQRLAAKPQGADIKQIAVRDFRGGMALNGQDQVILSHAMAIVRDGNERAPALANGDIDLRAARINCIFDQLLDGGCGTFDDLARSDLINERWVKKTNCHEGSSSHYPNSGLNGNRSLQYGNPLFYIYSNPKLRLIGCSG